MFWGRYFFHFVLFCESQALTCLSIWFGVPSISPLLSFIQTLFVTFFTLNPWFSDWSVCWNHPTAYWNTICWVPSLEFLVQVSGRTWAFIFLTVSQVTRWCWLMVHSWDCKYLKGPELDFLFFRVFAVILIEL